MEARSKFYKWCFVPLCENTTVTTPDKFFIHLPSDMKRRTTWWNAAKRDGPVKSCSMYCCEDHLILEEDLENYLYVKLMGGRIKLRKDAVPRKFECQGKAQKISPTLSKPGSKRLAAMPVLCSSENAQEGSSAHQNTSILENVEGHEARGTSASHPENAAQTADQLQLDTALPDTTFGEAQAADKATQGEMEVAPSRMACSDTGTEQHAEPAYILPDDVPDVKPDVAALVIKDEPQDSLVDDDSSDWKADLTALDIKYEQHDLPAISSTVTDDSSDLKPDLAAPIVEDEQEVPWMTSSTAIGAASQSLGLERYKCTGEEFEGVNIPLRHGLAGKCESFNERTYCITLGRRGSPGYLNTDKGAFSSGICEKSSSHKSCFVRHHQLHTGDKPYNPANCRKAFARRKLGTQHILIVKDEEPYRCDVCGKVFAQMDTLNLHMLAHADAEHRKCNDCGKTIVQRGSLTQDMPVHTGENSHKCIDCARRYMIVQHVLRRKGEELLRKHCKCDCCGKTYTQRYSLAQHMPPHTYEKRYKCYDCRMTSDHTYPAHVNAQRQRAS